VATGAIASKSSTLPSATGDAAATAAAETTVKTNGEQKGFVFNENRTDSIKQILKYAGSAKNEKEISAKLIEISSKYRSFTYGSKKRSQIEQLSLRL